MSVTVFGIRHHGPGSARSVLAGLQALQPDCVLVEGPPEASDAIALLAHADAKPPLALLVYPKDAPAQAGFYPFASFSPEYQAIRWAQQHGVPVRFADLPVGARPALQEAALPSADVVDEVVLREAIFTDNADALIVPDPITRLAQAAGYSDGERWWEHMVELRANPADIFADILDAMRALRESGPDPRPWMRNELREAAMRQAIRTAQKDGCERIAFVCGAWHAPALDPLPPAKEDAALLKGLKSVPVGVAWAPWTARRMSTASGYGAGVTSPGWYQHLWETVGSPQHVITHWLVKVAHHLRRKDIDASPAHLIETVRLAEALASMRGRAQPDLDDINEAIRSVLCMGDDTQMALIHDSLIMGNGMGQVPADAPSVPLQQDVQREQTRLRLKPSAITKPLDLDLRNVTDLDRSKLLHRLNLLGVSWGKLQTSSGKGTFRELWQLAWQPEFLIRLIENAQHGNTLPQACNGMVALRAPGATLAELTALLDAALLADLPDAVAALLTQLQSRAAIETDTLALMRALPPLARTARYGDVRTGSSGHAAGVVRALLHGLATRVCIGLPAACSTLDDDAAAEMLGLIQATHAALSVLDDAAITADWQNTLLTLAQQVALHGRVAGGVTRLVRDSKTMCDDDVRVRMSFALSRAAEPAQAAAWLEGFLGTSGQVLLLDQALWQLVDDWVCGLMPEAFINALPLVRRTFGHFPRPERQQMAQRAATGTHNNPLSVALRADDDLITDSPLLQQALPLLLRMLGIQPEVVP